MGLIIILMTIEVLVICYLLHKNKEDKLKDKVVKFFVEIIEAFVIVSICVITPISSIVAIEADKPDSKIERVLDYTNTYTLQEISPNIHAQTIMQHNYRAAASPMILLKINDEPVRIDLDYLKIQFNADVSTYTIHKYKYKNELLNWLLLNFLDPEKEIRVTEEMIYGEYDFTNYLEEKGDR